MGPKVPTFHMSTTYRIIDPSTGGTLHNHPYRNLDDAMKILLRAFMLTGDDYHIEARNTETGDIYILVI